MRSARAVPLILCAGLVGSLAQAGQGNCPNGSPGTTILFVNGIRTGPSSALDGLTTLRQQVTDRLHQSGSLRAAECTVFTWASNPTGGALKDLWVATKQSLAGDYSQFLQIISGSASAPTAFQNALTSLNWSQTDISVRDRHVARYEQEINNGNTVIAVAHSQGNFYANESYLKLISDGFVLPNPTLFNEVSVATPASETEGGAPYTTLCSDFIWRVPHALHWNENNVSALLCNDLVQFPFWQHGFEDYYLADGSDSQIKILNDIESAVPIRQPGFGNLFIGATLDGTALQGPLSYDVSTDAYGVDNISLPVVKPGFLAGQYRATYFGGGPANSTLSGIGPCPGTSPSATCQAPLLPGQTLAFMFRFTSVPPTAGFTMSFGQQIVTEGQNLNLTAPQAASGVVFNGTTRSSAANGGTITGWVWTIDGAAVASTGTFSDVLLPGTHAISLIVTDNRGVQSQSVTGTVIVNGSDVGSSWVLVNPFTSPSGRQWHSMTYDVRHKEVVLFGGYDGGVLGDTWTWDGTNWTQRLPHNHPSPRFGAGIAYDRLRDEVVLFGGFTDPDSGSPSNETWVWDGTDWTQRLPTTSPGARGNHAMAFDEATGEVWIAFGRGVAVDMWSWDGTNWTQRLQYSFPFPSPYSWYPAMAYDQARSQLVLYRTDAPDYTWGWNGTAWLPIGSAPPTASGQLVYDRFRQRVISFGGVGSPTLPTDTWSWDGSAWSRLLTTSNPTGRYWYAMAFDEDHQQVVLFGGQACSFNSCPLNDTWLLMSAH